MLTYVRLSERLGVVAIMFVSRVKVQIILALASQIHMTGKSCPFPNTAKLCNKKGDYRHKGSSVLRSLAADLGVRSSRPVDLGPLS